MGKRFQDCNKVTQIWRYRWYLAIPFIFAYKYIKGINIQVDDMVDGKIVPTNNTIKPDSKLLWKLIKGEVQGYMNWYYTSEEVFAKSREKLKRRNEKEN